MVIVTVVTWSHGLSNTMSTVLLRLCKQCQRPVAVAARLLAKAEFHWNEPNFVAGNYFMFLRHEIDFLHARGFFHSTKGCVRTEAVGGRNKCSSMAT